MCDQLINFQDIRNGKFKNANMSLIDAAFQTRCRENNPNNFSNWFPKIQNCGMQTPRSVIIPCPDEIIQAFAMNDLRSDQEKIRNWVKTLMPKINTVSNGIFAFIRNGTFANKFDASNCIVKTLDYLDVAKAIMEINYTAITYNAGGIDEIIFREFIPYDEKIIPCIYNGLPLRPEFRVFYDFDEKETLYTANYWDWDYCYNSVDDNATDRSVYRQFYPVIEQEYEQAENTIDNLIKKHMKNVNGLTGVWAIDVLQQHVFDYPEFIADNYWIIDMSLAENAIYWNPGRRPQINE